MDRRAVRRCCAPGGPASGAPPQVSQASVEPAHQSFAGFSADRAAGGPGRRWPVAPGAPPGRCRRCAPSSAPAIGDDLGRAIQSRRNVSSDGAAGDTTRRQAQHGIPEEFDGRSWVPGRSQPKLWGGPPRSAPDRAQIAERRLAGPSRFEHADLKGEADQLGAPLGACARQAGAEWGEKQRRKPGSCSARRSCGRIHLSDRCYQRPRAAHLCRDGVNGQPLSWACSSQGLMRSQHLSSCWCALTAPLHLTCAAANPSHRRVFCGTGPHGRPALALTIFQSAWHGKPGRFLNRTQSPTRRPNVPLRLRPTSPAFNPDFSGVPACFNGKVERRKEQARVVNRAGSGLGASELIMTPWGL